MLHPPPHVRDDPRLSLVYLRSTSPDRTAYTRTSTSWPDFATMRDSSGVLEDAAAFWISQGSLDRGTAARQVSLGLATGNMFSLLGAQPALGRWFGPAEDDPTVTETPAGLSDALWRGRFNADPAIIGRTIQVDARTYTVVGVAPRDFHGPQSRRVGLWVPLRAVAADFVGKDWESSRNMYWMRMIALRKASVSPALARERASDVHHRANRVTQKGDSLFFFPWFS